VSTIYIDIRLDIVVDSRHRSTAYTAVVMESSITLLRERIKSVTISPYTYSIMSIPTVAVFGPYVGPLHKFYIFRQDSHTAVSALPVPLDDNIEWFARV
jgi:hypothetical protein